jgi:hypothetical protein
MADYSLTGNANWSAIKASLNNGDRIVADGLGAWVLTLDEDPALTGIDFVSAAGAYVAIGTPATVTLSGWIIRATSNHGITVGSGKTATGPLSVYGSSTTADKYGCRITSGGAVGTVTAYGGSAASSPGITVSSGASATTITATGAAAVASYGAWILMGGSATTVTATAGGTSGAHGCNNSGNIGTLTATGSATNGAWGCANYGAVGTATSVGGSASGSHGLVNYGGGKCTSNTGNTSGAFGLDNYGIALSDVRNRVGDYAVRRSAGTLILYGGTSTTGVTGTAGDLFYIPTPANTVSAISVMGETGTYPTTATTQAADAAIVTTGKANVVSGVQFTFGASSSDAGTYPTTATTQAADAATLEAQKAYLLATKTITFGASSVVGTLAVGNVLSTVTGGTYVVPVQNTVLQVADGGTAYGAASAVQGTLTLPAAANVWYGSGTYGIAGTGTTPTKRASSITNCTAPNVRNGVAIDDVTGTNVGGGFNTDPGVANVRNGQAYTILNVAKSGTLDVAENNTTNGGGIGIGI